MSIKVYSEEWYKLRRTKIGASDASIILGENPWKKPYDLMLEKLGLLESEPMNEKMQRGLDLEDTAREWFYKETGITMMPAVLLSKEHDFMFASLDGIDLFGQHILEIKCPSKTAHNMAKKGKVPPYYIAQVQHQLSVTGLPMAYYMSFDGKDGIIIEVPRNEKYIAYLIEKERDFYQMMLSFVDDNDLVQYYSS